MGVFPGQPGGRSVLETEVNAVLLHGLHHGGSAVHEFRTRIVPRPAYPVSPAKVHLLASVDLHSAPGACDQARPPGHRIALAVAEPDRVTLPIDPEDLVRDRQQKMAGAEEELLRAIGNQVAGLRFIKELWRIVTLNPRPR